MLQTLEAWGKDDDRVLAIAVLTPKGPGVASQLSILVRERGKLVRDLEWTRRFGEALTHRLENASGALAVTVTYQDDHQIQFFLFDDAAELRARFDGPPRFLYVSPHHRKR